MSFLRKNNFSGKTIIPFCTHGGGGFGQIENDIAKECPNTKILPGIAVNESDSPEQVGEWLKKIGYKF
jgi:flavodoxin